MNERIYRASPGFLWASIGFAILGTLFAIDFVVELFEKLPEFMDSILFRLDLWALISAVACTALSIVFGMTRRNTSLTVGPGGIEARNLRGRLFFTVKWPEIVELEQGSNRPDWPLWRVIAKGKRLEVDGRYERYKEIAEEVCRHAPHLRP